MISTFEQLLVAATEQDEPQRLLLLFAKAEASDSINNEYRGTVSPVMCVDKLPEEIESFSTLAAEADNISKEWDFLVTVGLSGKDGVAPSPDEAEPYLNKMANDLASGQDMSQYVVFDRNEIPVFIKAS